MPDTERAHDKGSVLGPFCTHLCSKKSYFLRTPAQTEADILGGGGHCWCRLTMTILGPGGGIADPSDCRAGRACYVPPGGPRP